MKIVDFDPMVKKLYFDDLKADFTYIFNKILCISFLHYG